ncbi:MAG: HupV protein [Rhodocyclaceae bacterium]|nr:HupV protein [Rhodocyclaceae bacterium]
MSDAASSRRLTVGPFNRVEGDLEVHLDIAGGHVVEARVNAPLYRGFEQILGGRPTEDALVFVPRICGICSVSQSIAAATALADASGIEPPANGRHVINLIHACENLADHLSHFYLFFMPDFARPAYAGRAWFTAAEARFKAVSGAASQDMLPARARFMQLMGLLAGKWPHTLGIQPGGMTRAVQAAEPVRLLGWLREFRGFLERATFGAPLEQIAALTSVAELNAWRHTPRGIASDLGLFLAIADDLNLAALGTSTGHYLSVGAYPQPGGSHLFARGVWTGELRPFDPAQVTEDATHAWMVEGEAPLSPANGITAPLPDKEGAYTWCKAPRLAGQVVETGALARQLVAGHPLIREWVVQKGGGVAARVLARLLELARVLPAMEFWVRQLHLDEPYFQDAPLAEEGQGIGLTEAARGSLGHWATLRQGRLLNYQIIAPTTWNFSPRDHHGIPGALEQALVGAPVTDGEDTPLSVQHIVRSFDPCMVCTVH